jgi:hypothetical protein
MGRAGHSGEGQMRGGARHGGRGGSHGGGYGRGPRVTRSYGYGVFHGSMTARVHPRKHAYRGKVHVDRWVGDGLRPKPRPSSHYRSTRTYGTRHFQSRRSYGRRTAGFVAAPIVIESSDEVTVIVIRP